MLLTILQHVLLLLYIYHFGLVDGQTIDDNKRLHTELFTNRDYNKEIRPIDDQSQTLQVSIELYLTAIEQFQVTHRYIETAGYMFITWTDSSLNWNVSNYGGSDWIYIKKDVLWYPDFIQYGSEKLKDDRVSMLVLYSQGMVLQTVAGKYTTRCFIDVFLYPFDKHMCEFFFFSIEDLNLTAVSPEIRLPSYIENTEWSIDSTACVTENQVASFTLAGYRCTITVVRRSTYGMFHVFLPAVCLSILTILIFWLPVSCGERITFAITLFLAYTMTLTRLSDEIPRDSTHLPLYSYVLVIMNMVSAFCVVFSVVVTRIALSTKPKLPTFLRNLVLCLNPSLKRRFAKAKLINVVQRGRDTRHTGTETDIEESDAETVTDIEHEITWSAAAQAVDNVIFTFIVTSLLVLITIGIVYAF